MSAKMLHLRSVLVRSKSHPKLNESIFPVGVADSKRYMTGLFSRSSSKFRDYQPSYYGQNIITGLVRKQLFSDRPSLANPEKLVMNFAELQASLKDNKIKLIDVREKDEIKESGKIPGSVNIPIDSLFEALQSPGPEFEKKYGVPKPVKADTLVFHCRSGRRSEQAVQLALELGYSKAKFYKGGYDDYRKKARGDDKVQHI